MSQAAPPEAPMRRALFTVIAIVFVDLLGFGVIIPILPYYVRSFAAAGLSLTSLVLGAAFLRESPRSQASPSPSGRPLPSARS